MEMMYTFFQIHDVSDRVQHIKQLNANCAPYVNVDDERLIWMSQTFPAYINSIQQCSKDAESTAKCIKYLLEDSGFYYVLTRTFNSDAVESMFSHVRMGGGFQDATDARAAHYAVKRIIQCGFVKTAASANVFNDCSYAINIGHVPQSMETDSPDDFNLNLPYGISSASVAFLAGYLVRTIEERIDSKTCLSNISAASSSNPLLALIYFQDRDSLKYPSRNFIYLVKQITIIANEIVSCLPVRCNPYEVLTSILLEPLARSNFFTCKPHCREIVDIILSKLLSE